MTDSPGLRQLCEQLSIPFEGNEQPWRFSRYIRAGQPLSIIFEDGGEHILKEATWWLLLDKKRSGQSIHFSPSSYTSFNTRYDKLNKPGSAGFHSFRQYRCVIPATGFGETEGKGSSARYHDFLLKDDQDILAMGGLYRIWHFEDEEGRERKVYSCSVVTLPPHPKLKPYHTKASPLMLSAKDNSLQRWLNAKTESPSELEDLLEPTFRHDFRVVPVTSPSNHEPTGKEHSINADA